MKKLQKIIKERMNISKMSDQKVIQGLKSLRGLNIGLKEYYEIC